MTGSTDHVRGAGWAPFAGTLCLIVGSFNLIEGIVALSGDPLLSEDALVTGDLTMWGTLLVFMGRSRWSSATCCCVATVSA